jgi:hypothetical protein
VLNLASICLILFSKVEGKKKKQHHQQQKKTLKNMLENPSKLQKNKIKKKSINIQMN